MAITEKVVVRIVKVTFLFWSALHPNFLSCQPPNFWYFFLPEEASSPYISMLLKLISKPHVIWSKLYDNNLYTQIF